MMNWSLHYPAYLSQSQADMDAPLNKVVTVADIGCGFGGLLVALAPKLSDDLLLGTKTSR